MNSNPTDIPTVVGNGATTDANTEPGPTGPLAGSTTSAAPGTPPGPTMVMLDPTQVHGPPVKLSVCLIVKNEERTLARVLNSVLPVADELVIVDTGSIDKTVEIAEGYQGAKISYFEWCDDFAAARNAAFAQCTGDWIMWIDADDVLPAASAKHINNLKKSLLTHPQLRTVFTPYHYEYENDQVAVNLNRERLVRNNVGHKWIGRIHETLENPWPFSIRVEEIVVEHRTLNELLPRKRGRNLKIFDSYINTDTCTLRELFLYGSELSQEGRAKDAQAVLEKYLDRSVNEVDMCGEKYSVYMKLAEVHFQAKRWDDALNVGFGGIRLDPTRAECATIVAVVYYAMGQITVAIHWFVYAMACGHPAPTISLVVEKLYKDVPKQQLKTMFEQLQGMGILDRIKGHVETISQNAALINSFYQSARRLKKGDLK